jgi:hypothetical protein
MARSGAFHSALIAVQRRDRSEGQFREGLGLQPVRDRRRLLKLFGIDTVMYT